MQVHDVVELVTSEAPPLRHSVDEIIESGQRIQRRRRLGLASGAAALTVMAVMAAIVVPRVAQQASVADSGSGARTRAGASSDAAPKTFQVPSGPFVFTLKAYDVGRYHVAAPTVASVAYQRAPVFEDGKTSRIDKRTVPTSVAELVVYRPGVFTPARLTAPERVTVAGHEAMQQTFSQDVRLPGLKGSSDPATATTIHTTVLAWQYTTNAWATLEASGTDSSPGVPAPDMRDIAAALAPGAQTQAKLPFTFSYLPAGYQPVEVASHSGLGTQLSIVPTDGTYGGVLFNKPAPNPTGLTQPWSYDDDKTIGFRISAFPNELSNYPLKSGERPPAEPRCDLEGLCHTWSADGRTQIELVDGGKLPTSELIKILKSVTVATVDDPATWPDAVTALPTRP